jgi:hypothetical protein
MLVVYGTQQRGLVGVRRLRRAVVIGLSHDACTTHPLLPVSLC